MLCIMYCVYISRRSSVEMDGCGLMASSFQLNSRARILNPQFRKAFALQSFERKEKKRGGGGFHPAVRMCAPNNVTIWKRGLLLWRRDEQDISSRRQQMTRE